MNDRRDALLHEDLIVPLHHHIKADDVLLATVPGEPARVVSPAQAGAIVAQHRPVPALDEVETAEGGPRRFARSEMLRGGAVLGLGALLAATAGPRMSFAATGSRDLLVVIFLRGGMDGLSAVVPVNDPAYYAARPKTAVRAEDTFALDSRFAMNKNMAALKPMWKARELACVVGSGTAGLRRSHFEDMSLCERAAPANVRSGWLGRHLATSSSTQGTFRAITVGSSATLSLAANFETVALTDIASFDLQAWEGVRPAVLRMMHRLYGDIGGPVQASAARTLDAVNGLASVRASTATYVPAGGATYPASPFGKGLSQIAQIAKGGKGLEVACIDIGDWDMHQRLGSAKNPQDWFSRSSRDLAEGLAAFRTDLGGRWASTTVVTMSEFGRRVAENGDTGLDHGTGNVAFVAGGSVHGGKVYGSLPSLQPSNLRSGDVPVTVDYRQALSEIVTRRLGDGSHLAAVFPGFTPAAKPLGIV